MGVVVYSKTNCPQCVRVKKELTQKGIIYVEVMVDTKPQAHKMLVERGHRSVPVVYMDGVHIADPSKLVNDSVN